MKNNRLIIALMTVLFVFASASFSYGAAYDDVLAYWQMDGSAKDTSGTNNGTVSEGAISWTSTSPMNSYPTSYGWTWSPDSRYYSHSVSDGWYHVSVTSGGYAYHYRMISTDFENTGFTMETRMKVDPGTVYNTAFQTQDTPDWTALRLSDSGVALYTAPEVPLDTTQAHTYRITIENDEAKLFVDNEHVSSDQIPDNNPSWDGVQMGVVWTASGNVGYEYDYINYSTSGADSPLEYTSGKFGDAAIFDGVNDQIDVSDVALSGSSDWTLVSWVKTSSTAVGADVTKIGDPIFGNTVGGSGANFGLEGGRITSHLYYDGVWHESSGATNIADGEWHQLVWVNNGDSELEMYVDALLEGTTTPGSFSTSFRRFGDYNYDYLDGALDDVVIYDRALDPNELEALRLFGAEKYEMVSSSINDSWDLGLTTEELAMLAQLYADGKDGLSPSAIELGSGSSWEYYSGDLPGDFGGTTYEIGDSWVYEGRYYIKLGSGLGGAVPEMPPFAPQVLLVGFAGVSVWGKRRKGEKVM